MTRSDDRPIPPSDYQPRMPLLDALVDHQVQMNLVRGHVAGQHAVTRLGCPVCADLPRQKRESDD